MFIGFWWFFNEKFCPGYGSTFWFCRSTYRPKIWASCPPLGWGSLRNLSQNIFKLKAKTDGRGEGVQRVSPPLPPISILMYTYNAIVKAIRRMHRLLVHIWAFSLGFHTIPTNVGVILKKGFLQFSPGMYSSFHRSLCANRKSSRCLGIWCSRRG